MAKASIKTNVEKCRKYRNKMEQDPKRQEQMREKNRNRMQKTRREPQTVEQLEHTRKLARERQRLYDARKRQERQGVAAKGTAREKVENKREERRQASQNYRDGMTAQKKRRVKEKRISHFYKKKEAKMAAEVAKVEKAVQSEAAFQQSGCPYPTQGAYRRAVRRMKAKFKTQGEKLAHLLKGVVKYSDPKTRKALKVLNVSYSTPEKTPGPVETLRHHVGSLGKKRDTNTLKHKRRLAQAFKDCGEIEKVGISKRFSLNLGEHSPYKRRGTGFQTAITDFFHRNSCPDPCKSTKKRQLTTSVKELHKKYAAETKATVSLRTFHRHKPANVSSVKKLKFRQCLCEICLNPKMKLTRLNRFLSEKCDSVRDLLDESVCLFEVFPALMCVDRKCCKCGPERVRERLVNDLGENMKKRVSWSKWEQVKKGKSSRMEKVRKEGTVEACLQELLQELGPLCRHVFNAEWQRKQLQSLKAKLPEGWAIVTCDFAANFLCKFQDQPQSAHWGYSQVTLFPAVAFFKCPGSDCQELRRDTLIFLSDDLKHDAHFAQACVQQVLQHLSSVLPDLKKVILVSDGCSAQFKSKLPFLYLSHTVVPGYSDVSIEKVFFGSRHGKNDSDWCGGAVKRSVTQDIVAGRVTVTNARDMFRYCCKTLSLSPSTDCLCAHKSQKFFLIEEHQISRKMKSAFLSTVQGTHKLHHLRAIAPGELATRQLSCFCEHCMVGEYDDCVSSDHVDQWKIVKMKNPGPGSFLPEMNPTRPHEKGDEAFVTSSSEDESDEESHVIPDSDSEKESAIISSSESDLGVEEECAIVKVESMSVEEESDRVEEESDGVEDTGAGIEEHEDNKTFFRKLSTDLTSCASFSEVQEKARFWRQHVEDIKIPDSFNENPALGCRIDSQAANLLPSDLQGRCFPLTVYGDGNCFFRALSLLLYGTQDHHQEMRVRVVMAMALNPKLFLDGNNWCRELHNVTDEEIIKVAVLTSAEPASSSPFEDEVMAMRQNGTYAGLWEFFAASHVLKRPIQSVFPPLGWDIYRLHCNRIIKAPCCESSSKLIIMWTSLRDVINEEHWTPNHFVPLVPRFQ